MKKIFEGVAGTGKTTKLGEIAKKYEGNVLWIGRSGTPEYLDLQNEIKTISNYEKPNGKLFIGMNDMKEESSVEEIYQNIKPFFNNNTNTLFIFDEVCLFEKQLSDLLHTKFKGNHCIITTQTQEQIVTYAQLSLNDIKQLGWKTKQFL